MKFLYTPINDRSALAPPSSARIRQRNTHAFARMQAMADFVSQHCVGLVRGHYHVQRRLDPPLEDESSN